MKNFLNDCLDAANFEDRHSGSGRNGSAVLRARGPFLAEHAHRAGLRQIVDRLSDHDALTDDAVGICRLSARLEEAAEQRTHEQQHDCGQQDKNHELHPYRCAEGCRDERRRAADREPDAAQTKRRRLRCNADNDDSQPEIQAVYAKQHALSSLPFPSV